MGRMNRRTAGLGMLALSIAPAHAQEAEGEQLRRQQERLNEFVAQSRAPEVLARLKSLAGCARFAQAVAVSGLAERIAALPQVTIFVPADSAWQAAAAAPGPDAALVARHVCTGLWTGSAESVSVLQTLDGGRLEAGPDGAGGIGIERGGIRVKTGWLHVIPSFLPASR